MNKSFKIIGVYRINPTEESIVQAALYQEFNWLVDGNGRFSSEIYWDDLGNLSLVEIQMIGQGSRNFIDEISHGDQAPYLEYYLDSTGESLLPENQVNQAQNCRLCFFLHFTNIEWPLEIAGENVSMPSWSSLPERLVPFTHYLPVD
jgi:hypothetical protein